LQPGAKSESVLSTWAITEKQEGADPRGAGDEGVEGGLPRLARDLKRCGLRAPISVTTNGAPGLLGAVEERFLASLRQSCLAHKLRNVMVKVPQETAVSSGTRPGR